MWHDDAWERLMTLRSDCTEGRPMVCCILQAMKNSQAMNSQVTLTSDEFQSKTRSSMPGDQMETNEACWEDRAKVLKSNGNAVLIAGEDVLIAIGICHVMPMIVIETVGDEKCRYPFIRTRPTLSHQSMKLEERARLSCSSRQPFVYFRRCAEIDLNPLVRLIDSWTPGLVRSVRV